MKTCPECGCRTECGICSNCQEELYIITFQSEYLEPDLSKEFQETAWEQERFLKEMKRI